MKRPEKFDKKLLVEGNDDQHVIRALSERAHIAETFDVIDCDGFDNLRHEIPVRLKQSDIQTVGIIVDADTEINGRWMSVKNLLSAQGFDVPEQLPDSGLVLSNNKGTKAGVWIMPDNRSSGMIEDFISFLVPQRDKLMPFVDSVLYEIEKERINEYSSGHKSKAKIHTWLAWQKQPGTPLGASITKRYLTIEDNICSRLIEWLRKLFSE